MFHERTMNAAKGRWRGILIALGLPEACLVNKHGPCPLCDSKDNFRFDNREGSGSWICTCGAGDGMKLAMSYTGKDFRSLAPEIDALTGNLKPEAVTPAQSTEAIRQALRRVYGDTRNLAGEDLASLYLESRGCGEVVYPKSLRFGLCSDGEGGVRPTMVAVLSSPDGKPCTMHRTFLNPKGGKAEMDKPRKMMPGAIAEGACVRLSEWVPGPLGIAEGIETAMSASRLFSLPVWAATSADLMRKWKWPEDATEIVVFGDRDPKLAGQAAAWHLAHRIALTGMPVQVMIPEGPGKQDWNDVLMAKLSKERGSD